MGGVRPTSRIGFLWAPKLLRIAAILLIAAAISRPQFGATREEVISKGVDIMMILDTSGSMQVVDIAPGTEKPNPENTRLAAAKNVIMDFITRRRNDRIGLIKFAGKPYYQCPLTLDYGILMTFIDSIVISEKNQNTAIGDALGMAVLHLKDSKAESKVVVLVTDGENNAGLLSPLTAANAAKQYKIKIYTVGVGTVDNAFILQRDIFGAHWMPAPTRLDEETLQKIADTTGAKYFHATDPNTLKNIFEIIDSLEKTEIKTKRYTEYSERFMPWAALALMLLGFEIALAVGPLRQNP